MLPDFAGKQLQPLRTSPIAIASFFLYKPPKMNEPLTDADF